MRSMDQHVTYFQDNYEIISQCEFGKIDSLRFTDDRKGARNCRFCRRSGFEVRFRNVAHTIPEFMGNSYLISRDECDECNQRFSLYEDSLAKFLLPLRCCFRVEGKNGYPKLKFGGTRLSSKKDGIAFETNDIPVVEHIKGKLEGKAGCLFKLKTNSFTPQSAFLALTKIAVSICPTTELQNCRGTIEWLLGDQDLQYPCLPIGILITPRGVSADHSHATLLRRKNQNEHPFFWLLVRMQNVRLQIPVLYSGGWPNSETHSNEFIFRSHPSRFLDPTSFGDSSVYYDDFLATKPRVDPMIAEWVFETMEFNRG